MIPFNRFLQRKVILQWLQAITMNAAKLRGGCLIGWGLTKTVNGHIANVQMFLGLNHDDEYSQRPVVIGFSNHNQRIESWWSILRNTFNFGWIYPEWKWHVQWGFHWHTALFLAIYSGERNVNCLHNLNL